MFKSLRSFIAKHKKSLSVTALSAFVAATSCVGAFAAETSDSTNSQVQAQFTTAIGGIQNDLLSYILIIVPVVLGILGAIFGIKKAISFFKSMANKA